METNIHATQHVPNPLWWVESSDQRDLTNRDKNADPAFQTWVSTMCSFVSTSFRDRFCQTHAIFYRELSSFLWEIGEALLDFAGGAFLAHEKQQWSNELYVYRLIFWKPFSPKVNRTLPKQKVPPLYINSKLEHHPSKPKDTISFRFHGQSPQWPNDVFLVPFQTSPRPCVLPPTAQTSFSKASRSQGSWKKEDSPEVQREKIRNQFWLVVSTPLENIRQIGNLPQIGVIIENIWHHHLELMELRSWWWWMWQSTDITNTLLRKMLCYAFSFISQSDGYGIESGPSDFFVA